MSTLLVVDDDPLILQCFRQSIPESNCTLLTAASGSEGLEKFTQEYPDAVILDMDLPDLSGLEVFRRIHQLDHKVPVIFLTGKGTTDEAIEATRLGAYEYLLKPVRLEDLWAVLVRAFEISRLMRVPAVLAEDEPENEDADVLVGRSSAMQDVYKSIGQVASQDVTVLILGESGTGKELVARAIYQHSRRSAEPFLAINCAAIPATLLESELFGHEKGAFTGAERKRIGKFEQCSGGTLLLDEIGDMAPLTQSKFLRVLQEGQFERVGGNETLRSDIRLISATNRDLEQLSGTNQFRRDLFYRLNVYTIKLPPLRERGEDLPLLVEHFLRRFRRELGKETRAIDPQALEMLRHYPWPGNVRELQSVLKQAILRATGPALLAEFFPASMRSQRKGPTSTTPAEPSPPLAPSADWDRFVADRLNEGSTDLYAEWQALTGSYLFTQVLRHTGGNLSQAAKILGVHPMTLRTKVRALGISVERAK